MKTKITATPNYKDRSFEIEKKQPGKGVLRYRTLPMNPDEFNEAEYNTPGDWQAFLTYKSGSYYKIQSR